MKVCFGTYEWAHDVLGGGERQIAYYRNALQNGHKKWPTLEVSLFNQWDPGFSQIQIFHYFSCMPSAVDFLDYIKNDKGIPVLLSPNFWPEVDSWKESGVYDAIMTNLWLADKIIVNSFIEKEALVRICKVDPSRVSIVYNAVDECFFEPVQPSLFRQTFKADCPFVLNVANIEPRKNQLAFLKALKDFPELQLISIGSVRDKYYLDACIAEGGKQFRLIDALEPGSELIRSAMAACEFFAMPSLRETPSIASLEAAATGARLLTTDLGSTREYFEEHAIYTNPYSPQSMAESIDMVLRLTETETLRQRIRSRYRWDVVVNQLVETYLDVMPSNWSGFCGKF
jgi:glycosyltransferase involved in cell wall biosynthesis